MIRSGVAVAIALSFAAGCRGETAAPSEAPKADAGRAEQGRETPASPGDAKTEPPSHDAAPPHAGTQEPSMTTPTPPSPSHEPPGPPLAAADVAAAFQRWWTPWSSEHLATHPLRVRLDERVAAGGTVKPSACDGLAEHVRSRAPAGSDALLFGDSATLSGRSDRCWWLHHDGLMGPGLGAVLASDGDVLVVWIVGEG